MTTADLDKAQKIVSKAKNLTRDINVLQKTKSCKVILVLDSGHDLTLYAKSIKNNTTSDLVERLHQSVIEAMTDERSELQKEFEQL